MHILTFVFVRDSMSCVRDAVGRLVAGSHLAPDKEYPCYQKRCSCVGEEAYWDSIRAVDESPRGIAWNNQLKAAREAGDDTLERSIIRERMLACQELQLKHPGYEKADPECDYRCGGAGFHVYSRDPALHHDSWVIGGRWDGLFSTMEDIRDREGNSYRGNIARARAVPMDTLPAAIITADGLWYEQLVYFSNPLDVEEWLPYEKQEHQRWCRQVADSCMQHQDHFVVVVDVHL